MPSFSPTSAARLATCDLLLQELFNDVVQQYDCAILVGHRGQADQDIACHDGKSKTPWPTSCHNSEPSRAVDAAPTPIDWSDIGRFKDFAAFVKIRAAALGIAIRWGGDFKTLHDYDHFELENSNV